VDPPFTAGHWVPDLVLVAPCGFHLDGAVAQAGQVVAALPGLPVWAIDADAIVVRPGPARAWSTASRRSRRSCIRITCRLRRRIASHGWPDCFHGSSGADFDDLPVVAESEDVHARERGAPSGRGLIAPGARVLDTPDP
jgi:hypothetical protein